VHRKGRKPEPSRWSHEGLERRGYRKCPYCWRHLVKIEEHIAAHDAGLIGVDGRRRDRTAAERRRWAERHGGPAIAQGRRTFVPRKEYERILRLAPIDFLKLRRQIDALVSQDT